MALALFGNMSAFNPETEEWTQYATKLRYFFEANRVEDAEIKKVIFITVLGPTAFRQLRRLVSPDSVDDKTYKELVDALEAYHSPKPSEIVQRYKFYTRYRLPRESFQHSSQSFMPSLSFATS